MTARSLSPFAALDPDRAAYEIEQDVAAAGNSVGGTVSVAFDDFLSGSGSVDLIANPRGPFFAEIAMSAGTPSVSVQGMGSPQKGGWAVLALDATDEFQSAELVSDPIIFGGTLAEARIGFLTYSAGSNEPKLEFGLGFASFLLALDQSREFQLHVANVKGAISTGVMSEVGKIYKLKVDATDPAAVKFYIDDVQVPTNDTTTYDLTDNATQTANGMLLIQKTSGTDAVYVVADYMTVQTNRFTDNIALS